MLVIADNSLLRYLLLLGCIDLVPALFTRVMIPTEVQIELQRGRTPGVVRAWKPLKPCSSVSVVSNR